MRIIAIASSKGGTGKSTVALNLGSALSENNRVLVIDADEQQSIAKWQEISKQEKPDIAVMPNPGVDQILTNTKLNYDIILIDTPPSYREQMQSVLRAANKIIIPVVPGIVDAWSTRDFLTKLNSDSRLLISRVDYRTRIGKMFRPLLDQLHVPIFKTEIPARITIAESWAAGQTIDFYQPESEGARSFRKLAREVLTWLRE